jgi:hypothetical protein
MSSFEHTTDRPPLVERRHVDLKRVDSSLCLAV